MVLVILCVTNACKVWEHKNVQMDGKQRCYMKEVLETNSEMLLNKNLYWQLIIYNFFLFINNFLFFYTCSSWCLCLPIKCHFSNICWQKTPSFNMSKLRIYQIKMHHSLWRTGDLFRMFPAFAQQWLAWLQWPHCPRRDTEGSENGWLDGNTQLSQTKMQFNLETINLTLLK